MPNYILNNEIYFFINAVLRFTFLTMFLTMSVSIISSSLPRIMTTSTSHTTTREYTTNQTNQASPTSLTTSRTTTILSTMDVMSTTTKDYKSEQAIAIGVGIGVSCVLLAIGILVIFFVWKRKRGSVVRNEHVSRSLTPLDEVLLDLPDRTPQPTKIQDFLELLQTRREDKTVYFDEFKSLPPVNLPRIKSCSDAEKHRLKNRYLDILPYNEDRVKLSDPKNDYINASFIDGYNKKRTYIATQGPLNTTCEHFWSMVWEQNCSRIIMVANLLEDGLSKCAQYFPKSTRDGELPPPMTFGCFVISLTSEKFYSDYVIRTLEVEKESEKRTVNQFHYTRWPDKGVPDNGTSLIKFYKAAFPCDEDDGSGPLIIHCSAGVGRTGTLLAVDIISAQVEKEGRLDIAYYVDKMRRNRVAMVQTLAQYVFTHFTLAEMLLVGDVSVPQSRFKEYVTNLGVTNGFNKSNLKLQFELLNVSKPVFSEQNYVQGNDPANRNLNRFSKILPIDDFKPYLKPSSDDENEKYINAVFVGSHTVKERFIVTHAPMKSTIDNFWELVKYYKCSAIIMLNDPLAEEDNYWPADGQSQDYGELTVNNVGEISSDDLVLSQLKISNLTVAQNESQGVINHGADFDETESEDYTQLSDKNQDTLNVRHIRISGWPEGEPMGNRKASVLSMISEAFKCTDRNPDSAILVHCMNGAERSGVFCALFCILEKLETTEEVDVFNSVKKIQKNRPEFISSLEQLECLYEVMDFHLSSADRA